MSVSPRPTWCTRWWVRGCPGSSSLSRDVGALGGVVQLFEKGACIARAKFLKKLIIIHDYQLTVNMMCAAMAAVSIEFAWKQWKSVVLFIGGYHQVSLPKLLSSCWFMVRPPP